MDDVTPLPTPLFLPASVCLTWVVEDLCGREQPWHVGKLPQGTVHAGQPWPVPQDGSQALLGLTAGT